MSSAASSGFGKKMPYLNQIDALLHEARRYLAHAEQAAETWPPCGNFLARALEHATCAVSMAWGEPYAPERKMHRVFSERLAPHFDEDVARFVELVWGLEGHSQPYANVEHLLAVCRGTIDSFADLAVGPPPAGWEPLPIPKPVGWSELPEADRRFLQEALAAAAQWAPGVRLILFGSRAAGTARSDSDYDLFLIFPDQTEDWKRPQSIGAVSWLAIDCGIELSNLWTTEADWLDPPEVSRPLVERVKATGIEVPPSLQQEAP